MRNIIESIGRSMLAMAGATVVGATLLAATLAPSPAVAHAAPGTVLAAHR